MTTATSTMFLNEITVIDHAVVSPDHEIVGGSYLASFLVTGNIDPQESVVVDFSSIKKLIKGLIDDNERGYDHKLWVVEGHSNCTYTLMDASGTNAYRSGRYALGNETGSEVLPGWFAVLQGQYPIESVYIQCGDTVFTQTPLNAVRFVTNPQLNQNLIEVMQDSMSRYLEEGLNKLGFPVTIETHLSERPVLPPWADQDVVGKFRYVHGLKDSTSWGCQNVAHGHLSYLAFDFNGGKLSIDNSLQMFELLDSMTSALDNLTFINRENLSANVGDSLSIQYTTGRGSFSMVIDPAKSKVAILDTETTVEYLAEFVKAEFGASLAKLGVKRIYISEGLSKGAVIEV